MEISGINCVGDKGRYSCYCCSRIDDKILRAEWKFTLAGLDRLLRTTIKWNWRIIYSILCIGSNIPEKWLGFYVQEGSESELLCENKETGEARGE